MGGSAAADVGQHTSATVGKWHEQINSLVVHLQAEWRARLVSWANQAAGQQAREETAND